MKKISITFLLVLYSSLALTQSLNRTETIEYINNIYKDFIGMQRILNDINDETSIKKKVYVKLIKMNLLFDEATNTYVQEIDASYGSNFSSYRFSISKMRELTGFEIDKRSENEHWSTTSNSPLNLLRVKFSGYTVREDYQNSSNINFRNFFFIYVSETGSYVKRLSNAFAHLADIDKKEQKKDPFDN